MLLFGHFTPEILGIQNNLFLALLYALPYEVREFFNNEMKMIWFQ